MSAAARSTSNGSTRDTIIRVALGIGGTLIVASVMFVAAKWPAVEAIAIDNRVQLASMNAQLTAMQQVQEAQLSTLEDIRQAMVSRSELAARLEALEARIRSLEAR